MYGDADGPASVGSVGTAGDDGKPRGGDDVDQEEGEQEDGEEADGVEAVMIEREIGSLPNFGPIAAMALGLSSRDQDDIDEVRA